MKSLLITGGAGFIGSHVVRRFVNRYPDYKIYNLDKLTYAGNLENLKDVEGKSNYEGRHFFEGLPLFRFSSISSSHLKGCIVISNSFREKAVPLDEGRANEGKLKDSNFLEIPKITKVIFSCSH